MWPVPLLIVRPSYDFLNLSLAESARTPASADFIKARANPLCTARRARFLFSFLPAGRCSHDPKSGIVGKCGTLFGLVCPWSLQGQLHSGVLTVTRLFCIIKNTLYYGIIIPAPSSQTHKYYPTRLTSTFVLPTKTRVRTSPCSKQQNSSGSGWRLVREGRRASS